VPYVSARMPKLVNVSEGSMLETFPTIGRGAGPGIGSVIVSLCISSFAEMMRDARTEE
jgi:hypothetical protein